jgi:hypothetical protein
LIYRKLTYHEAEISFIKFQDSSDRKQGTKKLKQKTTLAITVLLIICTSLTATACANSANNAPAATAIEKDVIRQGDQFSWISPISTNTSSANGFNLGQTITLQAQLTSSSGAPLANVKILFEATLTFAGSSLQLNSTYITSTESFTNNQGIVQVDVKVPSDAAYGSTISVSAQTQSAEPQKHIDDNDQTIQNLLGISEPAQLAISTNVSIIGYVMVLPESPLGTLAGFGAVTAGFCVIAKVKQSKNKRKNKSAQFSKNNTLNQLKNQVFTP